MQQTNHTKTQCRFYYLDYFNNFLTIAGFAEYYGFTMLEAIRIITRGRK